MNAYKFRVLLDTENQDIFRDIVVQKEASMETFFNAIMNAFGFNGDQMASFYKSNENWDKGFEITLMDMQIDEDSEPVAIMANHEVMEIVTEDEQKLILVYDFMSMWIFLLELVGEEDSNEESKVVLSVGAAPNENSKELDENQLFEGDAFSSDDDEYGFDDEDFDSLDDYGDFGDFDNYDF